MSRIITALFDSRADADAGAERLHQAGIEASHVNVHDQSTHATTGTNSTHTDQGLWASIKSVFVPDEDRHAYEEGIRRGGFLLTAEVAEDNTATAVAALEDANSIDLDARSAEWRSTGWSPASEQAGGELDRGDIRYGARDNDRGNGRFRTYGNRTAD